MLLNQCSIRLHLLDIALLTVILKLKYQKLSQNQSVCFIYQFFLSIFPNSESLINYTLCVFRLSSYGSGLIQHVTLIEGRRLNYFE